MKKILLNPFLIFVVASCCIANAQSFSSSPVWSDEFNGNNILPDASVWNNEEGMIRNQEMQYYTDRDIDNQVIINGELRIIGLKENFGRAEYTSASITSKSAWKYGKIEGRIKMQTGMGIWGCFWMLGRGGSWPNIGEIDIVEHINSEPYYHATAHWWNENSQNVDKHVIDGSSVPDPVGSYNADEYNIYSVEWTPSYIKWFVNNIPVKTLSILNGFRGTWELHAPQYILLNCPIGGTWPEAAAGRSWNPSLIPVPNTMLVDYVRVYSYISEAPLPPTGLVASAVTQNSFNLNWTPSVGASAYDVIVENKGISVAYGPFTATNCSISGLTANLNYSIRIKARNAATNSSEFSEWSTPIFVTTRPTSPPTAIINLQLNENTGLLTANTGLAGGTLSLRATPPEGMPAVPPTWSTNTPENNSTRTSSILIANADHAVETPFLVDQLIGLNDVTISGWLNSSDATEVADPRNPGNRIASCMGTHWFDERGTGGFDLVFRGDGSLQIGINETVGASTPRSSANRITTDAATGASNWKFFAVTYSAAAKEVSFYFGDSQATAILDRKVPYDRGVLRSNIGPLAIGNFNSATRGWAKGRMFRGLIDQIQIYSASLNLSEIVAIQNIGTFNFVSSVSVTPSSISFSTIGETQQLTTSIVPVDASNREILWTTSNVHVATVNSQGFVTAVGPGGAIITATTVDGNFTSACMVNVTTIVQDVYEAETNVTFNAGYGSNPGPAPITSVNASGGMVVGNFGNVNSFILYNAINAEIGGTANLTIRYSNGTGVNQSLVYHYFSNAWTDSPSNQIVFPPTANWDTFAEITVSIFINAGYNQSIKLQKRDQWNYPGDIAGVGPRIDNFTLSFVNWIGGVSTAYENPLNWYNSKVPAVNSIINVPSNNLNKYPVVNTNQTITGATIHSGASLTINSGGSLSVIGRNVSNAFDTSPQTFFSSGAITNTGTITNNGTIINNGNLILQSNANGTANLVSSSAVNNVTQQRYLMSNQRGWRLLSNPLSNTVFSTLAASSNIRLLANYTGEYVIGDDSWTSTSGTAPFDYNKAYKVFITGQTGESPQYITGPTNVTLTHQGTAVNTTPSTITTTAGRFYLVANPYTAPVSVARLLAASSGLSTSVSYWNPTNQPLVPPDVRRMIGGYDIKSILLGRTNEGVGSDLLIPHMGAIFVQALTAGTINVPKSAIFTGMSSLYNAGPHWSTRPIGVYTHKTAQLKTATERAALTINVVRNGVDYDQLKLRFKEVGTESSNVDFGKMSNAFLDFYSIDVDTQKSVCELELKEQIIPLGITSKIFSNFSFKVAENTIPTGFQAVLVDKVLKSATVLTSGTTYTFAVDETSASQGNERFFINLKIAGTLSVADAVLDSKIQIWPNPAQNQFNILNAQNQTDGITLIEIVGLNGQVVYTQKLDPDTTITVETKNWADGVYILKATNNEAKTIKKLIIKK